jgi:hypothetical protein
LYFNHFLREIAIDTLFALCIFWTYQTIPPGGLFQDLGDHFALLLAAWLGFLVWVFLGSIRKVGLKGTLLDLFQFRELDTVIQFGSHWQMHFLSTLALMILLALPGTFKKPAFSGWIGVAFLLFIALSLVFRTGRKALTDRRWLMHGGREILTYTFVVAIPALGPIAAPLGSRLLNPTALTFGAGALLLGILAYYGWVYLRTDVGALSQGDFEVPYLIASHFFEHALDVVYIYLLVATLLGASSAGLIP